MNKYFGAVSALIIALTACGLNNDAYKTLDKALVELARNNQGGFMEYFLPGQKALYESMVKKSLFFKDIVKCWVEPSDQRDKGFNSGGVLVLCKYTNNRASLLYYYMTKSGGAWCIDYKRTLDTEMSKTGSHFTVRYYDPKDLKEKMESIDRDSPVQMRAESGK
jgi:hypothetical protein